MNTPSPEAGKYRWLLTICLAEMGTMLVFLNYSAVLPLLQAEWHLSSTEAGLIYSAYQMGYIALVVVLSTLTDYVGPKRVYVGSALWAGLANLLFSFYARDLVSAAILRTLTGFGLAGTYMPGLRLVSEKFASEKRGRAVGLYVAGFGLGGTLSLLLTGLIASLAGWRKAFVVTSFGPLAGGAIAFALLKGETELGGGTPRTRMTEVKENVFGNQPALLMIFGYVAHVWELYGMRGWLPAFLTSRLVRSGRGLTTAMGFGASLSAVVMVAGAISTALAGYLSDRFGRVRTIIALMLASSFCTSLLGWAWPLPFSWVVALSLASSFLATADSSVLSTSVTELVPRESLGAAQALQSFLGFGAASISPLLFGYILDLTNDPVALTTLGYLSHWGWAFSILGLGALVGPLALFHLRCRDILV
jgi:MFS family permease